MKEQKECEKLLALTDAMIQVQGIALIEQGLKLLAWTDLSENECTQVYEACKIIDQMRKNRINNFKLIEDVLF